MNAKQKAHQKFLAGIKQTTSVRQYAEAFEELVLKAEFHNPDMIASTFYNGLKYEVKRDLVGRKPDRLTELKMLAITLDKERMATQDVDRRDLKSNSSR